MKNKLQNISIARYMRVSTSAVVIVIGTALDLGTKAWARATLEPYGSATDFLPFIYLRLTFNKGVSFSMLAFEGSIGQTFLIGLTALLTLVMAVWAYCSKGWQRTGLSIIVSGALPNLIDRITRGSVTDFLGLHFWDWHPFVFNLADVWITLGVGILLISQTLPYKSRSTS